MRVSDHCYVTSEETKECVLIIIIFFFLIDGALLVYDITDAGN